MSHVGLQRGYCRFGVRRARPGRPGPGHSDRRSVPQL